MDTNSRQKSLIRRWWRLLIILLTPLVLLPFPLIIKTIVSIKCKKQHHNYYFFEFFQQGRCAYVVILLTVYWVSEAIPYAVTSLLPLSFFPVAGILSSDRVGSSYFKVSNYCFSPTSLLNFF
jgi:sodium-dependent dicarboxylate transporter 2/3/5